MGSANSFTIGFPHWLEMLKIPPYFGASNYFLSTRTIIFQYELRCPMNLKTTSIRG